MKHFHPLMGNVMQPVHLSLHAKVSQPIQGSLCAWVKGILQKVKRGEVEVGWGWCGKGECIEGPGVDRLAIAHHAHDGGLPLDDPDTEVLGLHLLALLVGYEELADVLLQLVGVPLRPWVVPIVVAAVVVDSWQCTSGR